MGRSNSRDGFRFIVSLDRAALGGLALGLGMYVMPFWREGRLRWAFWLTLISTVLHVYTSHRRSELPSDRFEGSGPSGQGGAAS